MAILPVVTKMSADISGADGIFRIQFLLCLNFRKPVVTAEQSLQSLATRRVDENMKTVLALLKNALASPSHDYAITHLRRLFNDPTG